MCTVPCFFFLENMQTRYASLTSTYGQCRIGEACGNSEP